MKLTSDFGRCWHHHGLLVTFDLLNLSKFLQPVDHFTLFKNHILTESKHERIQPLTTSESLKQMHWNFSNRIHIAFNSFILSWALAHVCRSNSLIHIDTSQNENRNSSFRTNVKFNDQNEIDSAYTYSKGIRMSTNRSVFAKSGRIELSFLHWNTSQNWVLAVNNQSN
jgi:hypothetical protein